MFFVYAPFVIFFSARARFVAFSAARAFAQPFDEGYARHLSVVCVLCWL